MSGAAGPLAHDHFDELRLAASDADLAAWIAQARPGSICVYARGGPLDPASAVARHARLLEQAGSVRLHHRRAGAVGEYLAVKLAPGYLTDPLRDPDTREPMLPDPSTNLGGIYALLARAARHRQPCPTNREIAQVLALPSVDRARYLVSKLAAAGHIMVENRGPRVRRVVTISASGARTSASRAAIAPAEVQG